jgi:WD40 repeat protein
VSEIRIPHACPASVQAIVAYGDGDRRFVLSYGGDTACWWDLAEGVDRGRTLALTGASVYAAMVVVQIRDGRHVAAARLGLNDLWRWDLSTGEPLGPVNSTRLRWHGGPGGPPLAAAAIGDGGIVVTSRIDGALFSHDLLTGMETGVWSTPHGRVWALAPVTLADGRLLIASGGTDGTVRLWDPVAATSWGDPIEQRGTPVQIVTGVLRDGRPVLCIANALGNVHRRDVITGEAVGPRISTGWQAGKHSKVCPIRVAWLDTPAGPVVATCVDRLTVYLWDAVTGQPVGGPLDDPGHWVTGLAASGARLLVADGVGNVCQFDAVTGERCGEVVQPHGFQSGDVHVAATVDGGLVLAVAGGGRVRCFDARTGVALGDRYRPAVGGSFGLVSEQLPDGRRLLVSADDRGIYRMDMATGISYPPTPGERPFALWDVTIVRLPDGRVVIAAAGHDRLVYRWDAASGVPWGEPLRGHLISVKAITSAARADAAVIVSGCEAGQVRRWNPETGEPIGEPLPGDVGMVTGLATIIFADGRQVVVGVDFEGGLHQWDPWTGETVRPRLDIPERANLIYAWVGHDEVPWAGIYVEDDDTGEVSLQLWRLDTGSYVEGDLDAALRTVYRDGDQLMAVTSRRDGSLLVAPASMPT